jgi:hypothetical protein
MNTFRELCARIVKLDEATRAEPQEERRAVYNHLLARQGDLTRRLHAVGYL